jgi:hypothetical protein
VLCVAAAITVAPYVYWCYNSCRERLKYVISSVLYRFGTRPRLLPEVFRAKFSDMEMTIASKADNHTHPEAAANRSSASSTIDRYGDMIGYQPLFVQRSRSDERNERAGSRVYYWVKDLPVRAQLLNVTEESLVALIDVDQYIDMPVFLGQYFVPTLVYTFQPSQVAKITPDYSYTFTAGNEAVYHVSGGAQYQHQIWNYGQDHMVAVETCFGFPLVVSCYLIDRLSCDSDHDLILLTPLVRYTGCMAILAYCLYGRLLSRLKVQEGPFTRMESHSTGKVLRSTGRIDSYAQATISAVNDDTIASIARSSKIELTMPQVMSFVEGDRTQAAMLLEYHRSGSNRKPDVVYPISASVRRYQFSVGNPNPEVKSAQLAFMPNIYPGCYVPDICEANDQAMVEGRVKSVYPGKVKFTSFLIRVMDEFLELAVPVRHLLHPTDDDEVYQRQCRPTQVRILDEAQYTDLRDQAKSFMKKESYAKPTDPRPITIIHGANKYRYSLFLYPVADYIKAFPWYAFGKTPLEIAERVVAVCNADSVLNSDLSRFDGHHSNVLVELETRFTTRLYHPKWHGELLELQRSMFGLRVYSSFDVSYSTEDQRASGSPDTSTMNSLDNAFIAFLALRMTQIDGVFYDKYAAWNLLGLYGGDDGLTPNVSAEVFLKAANMVGQESAAQSVLRGALGVKFLSRIYSPYVWLGDTNSCCDLPRQLVKLHVTTHMAGVTPAEKLLEKCRSFYLTDRHTPVLGDYVSAVIRVHGEVEMTDKTRVMRRWGSDIVLENQYPNSPANWMTAYADEVLVHFDCAKFVMWCKSITSLDQALQPIVCFDDVPHPEVKKSVVVGDEVLIPPKRVDKIVKRIDRRPSPARPPVQKGDAFKARERKRQQRKPKEAPVRAPRK